MKRKEKDTQDFTHGPRIIVLDESDFDGSWAESEEGKRKLAELKEWLNDKELGDYSNPGPIINKIYLSKRYLKWEDLKFTYDEQKIKVKLNGENYTVVYFISPAYYGHNEYEYVGILKDDDIVVYSINGYLYTANLLKQFFNNLHLEVIE
jgi:hypothetical protein